MTLTFTQVHRVPRKLELMNHSVVKQHEVAQTFTRDDCQEVLYICGEYMGCLSICSFCLFVCLFWLGFVFVFCFCFVLVWLC